MLYIFCYKKLLKTIGQILFVTVFIFFSTPNAESLEKYNKAENIADYFSGILLLNQSKYSDSFKYLKKKVSSNVAICDPSISASVMITIL